MARNNAAKEERSDMRARVLTNVAATLFVAAGVLVGAQWILETACGSTPKDRQPVTDGFQKITQDLREKTENLRLENSISSIKDDIRSVATDEINKLQDLNKDVIKFINDPNNPPLAFTACSGKLAGLAENVVSLGKSFGAFVLGLSAILWWWVNRDSSRSSKS